MPRHGRIKKRQIPEDAVHGSVLLQKFINKVMSKGQKSKAEKIIYGSLELAQNKLEKEPLEIFEKAMENVVPRLEVKARRVGGATYQVPVEVPKLRGQSKAMTWLKEAAQNRSGKSMVENLANELVDAFNGVGEAIKKREDVHKTADANKAFAHFRW